MNIDRESTNKENCLFPYLRKSRRKCEEKFSLRRSSSTENPNLDTEVICHPTPPSTDFEQLEEEKKRRRDKKRKKRMRIIKGIVVVVRIAVTIIVAIV